MSVLIPRHGPTSTRDTVSAWDFSKAKLSIDWVRFLTGIGYERSFEYPWVFNSLGIKEGMRVLDVGSSATVFSLFTATKVDCFVSAVDIDPRVLRLRQYAEKIGLGRKLASGKLEIVHLQNRRMPYPDGHFDKISCISTVEHNPDDEDTLLVIELMRVLRRGGLLALTFPLNREHRAIYTAARGGKEKPVFYEHQYTISTLLERLVLPSRGRIERMCRFGEKGFKFGSRVFYNARLRPLTILLRAFAPLFASWFISELSEGENLPERSFCCLLLRK